MVNRTKRVMRKYTNWPDVDTVAKEMAGNWKQFSCFAWHRGHDLEDADRWAIFYTSGRDAGLLEQSNHAEIEKLLSAYTEGDDPDVVAESHSHWAVGSVDGFSIRIYGTDGGVTDAFKVFCWIKKKIDDYPILNESDYSDREYEATLENYRNEMWAFKKELPQGWESEVYSWFSDNGHDQFTENRDDQGGWASKEKIIEALQSLGLMPNLIVEGTPNEFATS